MPAKSKKQFRYMKAQRGKKISQKTADEYTEGVGYKDLPEAVGKKLDESKKRKPKKRKGK